MTEALTAPRAEPNLTVSVIIVTFCRPDHLRECLRHVMEQTYEPVDVIVVDASPDDQSRKVVEEFSSVRYLRNELGAGTTATSRRIGLAEATSDIVVFFDDDAYADPDCIERLLTPYADPAVGGVGGRASNSVPGEESEGAGQIGMLLPNGTLTGFFGANPGRTIVVDHLLGANMSWRRSAILDAGGIQDLYPGTCLREETDIAFRVSRGGWRLIYTPFALVRHVAGPYAKGKRFDRRYTYFSNRNHVVLLATNFGWRSPYLRHFLGYGLREMRAHFGRAARFSQDLKQNGARSGIRTLAGGMTRPLWIAAGLVTGIAVAAKLTSRMSVQRPIISSRCIFILPEHESYAPSGGAIATVVHEQVKILESLGEKPLVITPPAGEPLYQGGVVTRIAWSRKSSGSKWLHMVSALNARARRLPHRGYAHYFGAIRNALRNASPEDLVIVGNDATMARLLADRGHRVILWLHNLPEFAETERVASLATSVRIVAVSQMVREWTIKNCRLAPERITTIHNGVDASEFTPRDDWLAPRNPVRVICHGRIDPNKGFDVAARAVALLRREGFDVDFTLVGEVKTFGWQETVVSAYVADLEVALDEAEGTRTGRVPPAEVPALLAEHDIACVLSRSAEPFGLAALEGMAAGCATVVTNWGALPEVVGDAGALVERDSVKSTAESLRALLVAPDLLASRKQAARARALEFTWEIAVTALLELTKSWMDKPPMIGDVS